jgi:hypothetical protein
VQVGGLTITFGANKVSSEAEAFDMERLTNITEELADFN